MRKLRALVLCLPLLVPGFSGVGLVVAHAAHADEANCDASYLPCDGSNMDYLNGTAAYPTDPAAYAGIGDGPNYDQGLGDIPYWETLGDCPSSDAGC